MKDITVTDLIKYLETLNPETVICTFDFNELNETICYTVINLMYKENYEYISSDAEYKQGDVLIMF
jgi:hypothetical protein